MYIQHIPYRGIGSKRTYKLRILCKYIIITFCCQLLFPTKISNKNIRRYMCTAGYHIIIHSSVCKYYLLFRNPPLCHSSSTSAASPSPPGLAVLGWSLYMHQVSHLQRSQEVSQGIRPPEQSPAHMDSCLVHNS